MTKTLSQYPLLIGAVARRTTPAAMAYRKRMATERRQTLRRFMVVLLLLGVAWAVYAVQVRNYPLSGGVESRNAGKLVAVESRKVDHGSKSSRNAGTTLEPIGSGETQSHSGSSAPPTQTPLPVRMRESALPAVNPEHKRP